MPILNYTTKIEARKTAGEISEVLADLGANSVQIEYDSERYPIALSFSIVMAGRSISFRLPSRWRGVHKVICDDKNIQKTYKTEEQSRRVAWRIIKDWTLAQVAIIQSGSAELTEVFLPYVINPANGITLYEEFKGSNFLGPGTIETEGIIENE